MVKLARLEAKRRIIEIGLPIDLVSTVHDSIVADTYSRYLDVTARILLESVQAVPRLVKEVWDYDFDLPLTAEVQYGQNKRDMQDYKFV